MPFGVKSAFVADAEAVLVVVLAVSTDVGFSPSGLNAAVATHDIVIAYALPPALAVPLVNLPCARCLAGAHGTAMDDQECDAAHMIRLFTDSFLHPMAIVDAYDCTSEGENLTEGSQDCGIDDSSGWNKEGNGDEKNAKDDKKKGKKKLMFHNRCEDVKM